MLRKVKYNLGPNVSGQPAGPIFKEAAWLLKKGLIGSPEIFVTNYQTTLPNTSEE